MPKSGKEYSRDRSAIREIIRPLYDFRSHFLKVGGFDLHYLDEGQGEPVLLLHGNPSWSFMYRDLIRSLRGKLRVIVPDHLGCGLSSIPAPDHYSYTLRKRVADLECLVDSLNLNQPLSLVVHDWGGLIGMAFAARRPEQIDRIVVLNTAAFTVPSGKRLHWILRFCRSSPAAAFMIQRLNAFSLGAVFLGSARRMPRLVRQGYLAPYSTADSRIAVLRFVQDIPLEPAHPSFPLVKEIEERLPVLGQHPLMICWGDRDFIFNQDFLDRWTELFPGAQLHRFAEAGHYILEDAADRAVPLILQFLLKEPS